jgi:NAD(P)-dependent dehydrogenase (short-subunit alcohol dehydrogenase family)
MAETTRSGAALSIGAGDAIGAADARRFAGGGHRVAAEMLIHASDAISTARHAQARSWTHERGHRPFVDWSSP